MAKTWKAGSGKIGFLKPYEGHWFAEGDSPMGPYRVTRTLRPILGKGWLAMDVSWRFGSDEKGKAYEEHAVIGTDHDGTVRLRSFTSDGKRSEGTLADLKDPPGGDRFSRGDARRVGTDGVLAGGQVVHVGRRGPDEKGMETNG